MNRCLYLLLSATVYSILYFTTSIVVAVCFHGGYEPTDMGCNQYIHLMQNDQCWMMPDVLLIKQMHQFLHKKWEGSNTCFSHLKLQDTIFMQIWDDTLNITQHISTTFNQHGHFLWSSFDFFQQNSLEVFHPLGSFQTSKSSICLVDFPTCQLFEMVPAPAPWPQATDNRRWGRARRSRASPRSADPRRLKRQVENPKK